MRLGQHLIDELKPDAEALVALRHDLHAHPEIGLEETRTSAVIARQLAALGYKVHTGLAKTGVVGTLSNGSSERSIGLRADIDALPIEEETGLSYASTHAGRMHACGHDGHTTMLLGAAQLIARRRAFNGTVHLIFQPAEENLGGARIMMDDGLFKLFPCDSIFAAHNEPGLPVGSFLFREGPMMAAIDQVQITLHGRGGHGSTPHETIDPVIIGASLTLALQSIVSRNLDAHDPAVVTVGCLRAGAVCNVIPETAFLDIGIRFFQQGTGALIRQRIAELAAGQAQSFGGSASLNWLTGYPVTINDAESTRFARSVGTSLFGPERVSDLGLPYLGSEDFAFMLEERKGAYLMMGNGEHCAALHNPHYNFNDAAILPGAAYWTGLVESFLPR